MDKAIVLNYLTSIKEKYHIIKALFGSYACNEADSHNDIDVLIEATPQFAQRYGF